MQPPKVKNDSIKIDSCIIRFFVFVEEGEGGEGEEEEHA